MLDIVNRDAWLARVDEFAKSQPYSKDEVEFHLSKIAYSLSLVGCSDWQDKAIKVMDEACLVKSLDKELDLEGCVLLKLHLMLCNIGEERKEGGR